MLDRFRKPIMVLVDLLLINLSLYLAFAIRFDWQLTPVIMESCIHFMLWASGIKITLFAISGMYQWSFRYASISEAINLLKTITVGSLLLIVIAFFARHITIGRSVLLIDYLLCLFLIGASRYSIRILIKFRQASHFGLKRTLIIGAGASGEMVARELINVLNRIYQPVGFIDDDPAKIHSRIHGIKVLGTTDDIKELVGKYNIEEIIIAIPSANGRVVRKIVSKCEKTDVRIKTVPALHKILTGEISVKQIRDVQPEDLLGRKAVEIDTEDVSYFIKDKTILVTGAAGSIGSELCRQIMGFDPKLLILYDHDENNSYFLERELKSNRPQLQFRTIIGEISDIGLLKCTFSKYRPHIVFHSAAHKHIPLMEKNPVAAVENNIIGARNIMYAAEHYKVESFVMISTDKAMNPTSIMGVSKYIAEMMMQAKAKTAKTKFMSVRFGNVMGSSGSVVPIFKQQIEKGGPVTVTHPEVKRFFMTMPEAAQLVLQAGAIGNGGEIFVLDMGEQIKIADLARNLIRLSGFEPGEDIEIKFTGLRPGDKMHGELLFDRGHDKPTKHNKIYVTRPDDLDPLRLRRDIKALERLANLMLEDKIIEKMKEIAPSYKPEDNGA